MQLDYNVLWVDDNNLWRKAAVRKIKKCIEDCGFEPNIKEYSNGDIIFQEDFDLASYDLIFMDYDLTCQETGNNGIELIKRIRERKIYSNIIFYSSITNDLSEKVKENEIQNTYIFDKEYFRDENIELITEVIEFILNRANSLNIMRGIVMAELANFDNEILSIISKVELEDKWTKIFDLITRGRQRYCNEIIVSDSTLSKISENCELIRSKFNIEELKKTIFDEDKSSAVFPSAIRANFINTILKEKGIKLASSNDFKSNYNIEIIKKRNKLGHCINIDECADEDFLQIRKNIIKHRKNLAEIKKLLLVS